MADPVLPNSYLRGKIDELNRRRGADWGRFGAAIIPSFNAGQQGGQAAAIETAASFYPRPQKAQDPLKAAAIKAGIIEKLVENDKARETGKVSAFKAMQQNYQDIAKLVLEQGRGIYGDYVGADSSVASSINQAAAKMADDYSDAVLKQVETAAAPGMASGVRAAFERIRAAMQGEPNDPSTAQLINNEFGSLLASGSGGRGAAAALSASLEAEAARLGHGTFNHYVQGLAGTGDPAAAQANDLLLSIGDEASLLANEATAEVKGTFAGAMSTMRRGVAGTDKAMSVINELWARFGPGDTPEEMSKAIDDLVGGGPDGKPTESAQAAHDLLTQLDNPNLPPASNLAELRRRLFEDPKFKEWMRLNGFSDPRTALTAMRQMAAKSAHQERQADRQARRQQVLSGKAGTPMPESKAPVSGGPETGKLEPTFVRNPSGGLEFYGEDGRLRAPTPDELDELDQMLSSGESALSIVKPSSEYENYKSASSLPRPDASSPEASKPVGGQPAAVKPVTLGMVGHEAGFAALHPAATVRTVEQFLSKKLKKKKPQETAPGAPATLGP